MSETNNKTKNNPAIACGDIKLDEKEGIILDQGKYGPSKTEINQLAGMEIKFEEESMVTNETEDGRIAMMDKKTGTIMGYLDDDGTINRKLTEMDKKKAREEGPEI